MEWGAQLEHLLSIQETMGFTPQALTDRPTVAAEDQYYLRCFYELSGSRQIGEVPGPIPLSEYVAYCALWHIDDMEEREKLVRVIRALDSEYQTHMSDRSKKQQEKIKLGRK